MEKQSTQPAAAILPDLKHISISDIQPDPNQPRKYFDKDAEAELLDSVRQSGVHTPISIRPNPGKGKKYLLITGERRLRAATSVMAAFKSRDTIPCTIVAIDDDEALHRQIVENLQRQDVHPIEEAVAFKSLLESKTRKHTIDEVAAKVGKSAYFIRQRIKLTSLTPAWQEVFFKNKITASQAIMIAPMAEKEQGDLYKSSYINKSKLNDPHFTVDIDDDDIERVQRKLKKAPFDTTDATLQPVMGACTTCRFNSAFNQLFPDQEKDPICNNASCFEAKCEKAFDIKVKDALNDPTIILVNDDGYPDQKDRQYMKKLKDEGHVIYESSYGGNCRLDDDYDYKGMKGVPVKALVICGQAKGKMMMAKINTKAKTSAATERMKKDGKLSAADVTAEVNRINERQRRNAKIDANKIHRTIIAELNKAKKKIVDLPYQAIDRGIMIYILLYEVIGARGMGVAHAKVAGLPSGRRTGFGYNFEYFTELSKKVSDKQLAAIVRELVLDKWAGNMNYDLQEHDTPVYLIAKYGGIDIAKIHKVQYDIAAKRAGRVKARINSLRKPKPVKKPAKKVATGKVKKKK